MVVIPESLDQMGAQELRELLIGLMTKVEQQEQTIILTRLPTQRNSQIEDLLPHRWTPQP